MKQALKHLVRKTGLRRTSLASARMCCERNLLARLGKRPIRETGRILCYHSVGQPLWGVNDVSPILFRRHLEIALSLGYRFVPASEIATALGELELATLVDESAGVYRATAAT